LVAQHDEVRCRAGLVPQTRSELILLNAEKAIRDRQLAVKKKLPSFRQHIRCVLNTQNEQKEHTTSKISVKRRLFHNDDLLSTSTPKCQRFVSTIFYDKCLVTVTILCVKTFKLLLSLLCSEGLLIIYIGAKGAKPEVKTLKYGLALKFQKWLLGL
jgi:hypothetical protein